ncbi:unnamed protein product [Cunninghamella echinulata]
MMIKKQVTFSGDIELIDTFANEDYDRSAQQVAKLSYHDMYELLVLKSQIKQQMLEEQKKLYQQQQQQQQQEQQDHHQHTTASPTHSPIYISIS